MEGSWDSQVPSGLDVEIQRFVQAIPDLIGIVIAPHDIPQLMYVPQVHSLFCHRRIFRLVVDSVLNEVEHRKLIH